MEQTRLYRPCDNAGSRRQKTVAATAMLAAAIALLFPVSARASGEGCGPEWTIDLRSRDECRNIAALSPGNDTRANLLLLLYDRDGGRPHDEALTDSPVLEWRDFRSRFTAEQASVPGFAAGEASRCRSNEAGSAAFTAAVGAATGLPTAERDALLQARTQAGAACASKGEQTNPIDDLAARMQTALGKAFAAYLHGVAAFYGDHMNDAGDDFALARRGSDPWLADTAAYMEARTNVNRMQVNAFDEYGDFRGAANIDQHLAEAAQASLEDYVATHPQGRYVRSARGLQRRVAWLAGWTEKLAGYYAALLAAPASERGVDDASLAEEIDSKLLSGLKPEMTRDPILLAVLDLKNMRRPESSEHKGQGSGEAAQAARTSRADLDAQRAAFGSAEPLREFLEAAQAFYVEGTPEPVVHTIHDDTRRRNGDNLWFSRQMLRGAALEARGDRNAQGFWKELHPGTSGPLQRPTVELALALHDEAHGDLADVFATGSLIANPEMRSVIAEHTAGPALLRRLAHEPSSPQAERDDAMFTLLRKELARGAYGDFLTDLASADTPTPAQPDAPRRLKVFLNGPTEGEIGCPALRTTVSRLAAHPDAEHDQLCLGDFYRLNDLDQDPSETRNQAGSLGGAPSQYPGQPKSRQAIYRSVIADADATVPDRSYALFRAVKCYEPTGINGCGGADAPKASRKAWYYELKRTYPASRWASELHYWW